MALSNDVTLTFTPAAWGLGASAVTDASGAVSVAYVAQSGLTGTWRTNQAGSIALSATFAAPVTGFAASMVAVSGGAVYNFSSSGDGSVYTFSVKPSDVAAAATLTVSVAAGAVTTVDTTNLGNNLAATYTLYYDPTPPVALLTSNATKGSTTGLYVMYYIAYGKVIDPSSEFFYTGAAQLGRPVPPRLPPPLPVESITIG